jgi:hypothetical protein
LANSDATKGFYIIEHILLRPRSANSSETKADTSTTPDFLSFARPIDSFAATNDLEHVICCSNSHGLQAGDSIIIFYSSHYSGIHQVQNPKKDTFEIIHPFIFEDTTTPDTGQWVSTTQCPDPFSFQISIVCIAPTPDKPESVTPIEPINIVLPNPNEPESTDPIIAIEPIESINIEPIEPTNIVFSLIDEPESTAPISPIVPIEPISIEPIELIEPINIIFSPSDDPESTSPISPIEPIEPIKVVIPSPDNIETGNSATRTAFENFKELFRNTLISETPAHITLHLHWLTQGQMEEFEAIYNLWLQYLSGQVTDLEEAERSSMRLINLLGLGSSDIPEFPPLLGYMAIADENTSTAINPFRVS